MTGGTSPTQRPLDHDHVARLAKSSFGRDRKVVDCGPLTGGGFGAVWWAALDDGRRIVLKASPPPDAGLLRYERDVIAAEARYFRLVAAKAPSVPVPRVLHHGQDTRVLDGDWLFTSFLPGRPLSECSIADDDGPAREQHGAATAELHTVSGTRYGYDGNRTGGATWCEAFTAMVEDLLADAADWKVELPASGVHIRRLIRRYGESLDAVDRPVLLHFDGWDGNILATRGDGGVLSMAGLVDGERHLYGDPLMDFVSPALFRRIEDEPQGPFLRGYAARTGAPLAFGKSARHRLSLYRFYFTLLMTIEMPSRGITAESDPGRHDRLGTLLEWQLSEL